MRDHARKGVEFHHSGERKSSNHKEASEVFSYKQLFFNPDAARANKAKKIIVA